ncbi:hypothetical protein [Salinarimonas ramus]|uniref:Uncharacterized protein n=1 Tax=Salinarimonas ramus TaxID=690164 RepID=A0A917QD69_9HYPH|nr:hypothetical protein [Salinarimonas ramus]GGK45129.1 hypothetical protein GCM10011322_35370 [Salinarimonas ramus]
MKAFLASLVVALVVAVGAAYLLETNWQSTAADTYATSGARVGDPGDNLVGSDWYSSRS